MSTIGNTFVGIIDYYKRTDRAGAMLPIVEALHQLNPLMQDAYVEECNNGTNHRSAIRTGLGAVAWGKIYQGILQSKSTTMQVEDTTGFVERLATLDTRLLDQVKNPGALRMQEASAALEAISQDVQSNFFYADSATTPERFKGLAARYNAISGGGAAAAQIVDAGGTGSDNMSVWGVGWGAGATSLIYPEGSKAGIVRQDKGEQRTLDANNMPYFVKEEYFAQHIGVKVADWRFNVRIANIDASDLLTGTTDPYKFLRLAYYKMQERRNTRMKNGGMVAGVKPVFYANRDFLQALDAKATNGGSSDNFVRMTPDEVSGKEVMTYRGIPIRETDALISAEARVV
jgi:hypothetical protein